jgi:hypothetical protein
MPLLFGVLMLLQVGQHYDSKYEKRPFRRPLVKTEPIDYSVSEAGTLPRISSARLVELGRQGRRHRRPSSHLRRDCGFETTKCSGGSL